MKAFLRIAAAAHMLPTLAVLAACQSGKPEPGEPLAFRSGQAALPVMERVARAAQSCWFASGDPSFRPYRLADELNSYSGRPRILLVPASQPEARPLLVVQAEGEPAEVEAFGPLMGHSAGARIAADVRRWAGGSGACSG